MTSGSDRDQAVFAELYPSLLRVAAVVRPPEVDAHDLVQEALVQTLLQGPLSSFDDPEAYLRVVETELPFCTYTVAAIDRVATEAKA